MPAASGGLNPPPTVTFLGVAFAIRLLNHFREHEAKGGGRAWGRATMPALSSEAKPQITPGTFILHSWACFSAHGYPESITWTPRAWLGCRASPGRALRFSTSTSTFTGGRATREPIGMAIR